VVGDGAVGPPPVLWQHDGAEPIIALSRHASYAQLRSRAASTSKTVIDLQASLPTPSWNVVCLTSPQITAPTSKACSLLSGHGVKSV